MHQSKLETLLETALNMVTGFLVSWFVWMYVVPVIWPEHASEIGVAFWLTALFTVTSFARSYIWRRFFNNIGGKLYAKFIT